jgi:hypothetical protein
MSSQLATVTPTAQSQETPQPLLIDEIQDVFDVTIAAHAIVNASISRTYAVARELDFLSVRSPLLAASVWARALPMKVLGRPAPPRPDKMSLGDEMGIPG